MGLRNRLADWISEDGDPDPRNEVDTLEEHRRGDPPEPYDVLEEMSGEEIATHITGMEHPDRMELLANESIMFHHWEKTKRTIDTTPALRNEYGLDEQQTGSENGIPVCLNHEYTGPIKQEQYRPKQQWTIGHKHSAKNSQSVSVNAQGDIGNNPLIPAGGSGGINGSTGTNNTQEANAQYTEINERLTMTVCKVDPDNCPTSMKSFYNAAREQYKMVRNKYERSTISGSEEAVEEEFGTGASTQKTDDTTEIQQTGTEPAEKTTSNVNGQPDGAFNGKDTDENSSVTPKTDKQAQSTPSGSRNTDAAADHSAGQTTRTDNESTADDSGWTFGDSDASDIRTQSNNTNNNSENSNL